MRLRKKSNNYLNDEDLKKINKRTKLIFTNKKNIIENGLRVSVDLSNNNKICAHMLQKKHSLNINFSKINFYEIKKFWEAFKAY